MKIALIGNQNCGKTTLFNLLTGARQKIGNFPGVTVDVATGELKGKKDIQIVDLPGVYSLSPYSQEETVTRNFLLDEKPDCVINILDATNLNRNLYLTMQLLEINVPVLIALNMMDEVRANGTVIDLKALSELLGAPVMPISATKNQGVDELIDKLKVLSENPIQPACRDLCDGPMHTVIHAIAHLVEDNARAAKIPSKFAAIRIIEKDKPIIASLKLRDNQVEIIEHFALEIESALHTDREAAVVDMRYNNIEKIYQNVIKTAGENKNQQRTDKIDRILTHRIFAIPIFILVMGAIFGLTFGVVDTYVSDAFASLLELGGKGLGALLKGWGASAWMVSLVVDGIYAGVTSVLGFLPTILFLFFFLSIVEDTGYMARVAFVMDRLLRKIGLSGRSIVPMLIGFGCSVPAYMATRTLSSDRDRKMTMMLVPFMSCSAKIPIYAVFTMVFFQKYRALIMLAIYFLGIVVGIIYALILQKTRFKGQSVPFVMELPPYRFPSFKTVMTYLWDKAKGFISKAFTIIFVASIVVWFLRSFDFSFDLVEDGEKSILAAIGKFIAPVFTPLGFGDWRAATAILTGISAKEAVVSTLAILFGVTQSDLPTVLGSVFQPLQAFSFLVFCSLYMPCVAAFATCKKELNSFPKTLLIMALQTAIAYVVSLIIYTLGLLFSLI